MDAKEAAFLRSCLRTVKRDHPAVMAADASSNKYVSDLLRGEQCVEDDDVVTPWIGSHLDPAY